MATANKWHSFTRAWIWLKIIEVLGSWFLVLCNCWIWSQMQRTKYKEQTNNRHDVPKTHRFRKRAGAARLALVGSVSQTSWSESSRLCHQNDRNADVDIPQLDGCGHAAEKNLWHQLAGEGSKDARPVRFFLRFPAPAYLRLVRSALQSAECWTGRRQTTIHPGGNDGISVDAAARDHVDK